MCQLYPSLPTCQPSMLVFMTFMVEYFGHPSDYVFTKSADDDEEEYDFYGVTKKFENTFEEEYDFIVVGAGAAGCVVANRLSEEENWKVLLLEAGKEEPNITSVPGFQRIFHGSTLDWGYQTLPEPIACAYHPGHRCPITQGKVMGGSSSVGDMYFLRGNKLDYDNWAKLGNVGWSSEDLFPYFLKSEDMRDDEILSLTQPENFVWNHNHSTGGYLSVERNTELSRISKLREYSMYGWNEVGLGDQFDCNGQHQVGVTRSQTTSRDGVRQSSNAAFLNPIREERSNLVVKTDAHVTRVILENRRAVGVEYYIGGYVDSLKKAYARKEVIVSAGVFGSPKVLMLSGIGHSDELRKSGIEVIQDLPVGDNLHDHVKLPVAVMRLRYMSTIVSPDSMEADARQWLETHQGELSHVPVISSLMVFAQSNFEEKPDLPDIQFIHTNALIRDIEALENYNGLPETYYPDVYYDAYVMYASLLNPKSRGTVRLNNTWPLYENPLIRLNYLTDKQDMKRLIDGASLISVFLTFRNFSDIRLKMYEHAPKACEDLEILSRSYLECMVRNYAEPAFNFVGTCKMGPEGDQTAVVDPRLKVHGVKGLRVIDASVMPTVPRASTYAPTVMIAEKGSDMIKDDWSEDGTPDDMIKEDWRNNNKSDNVENLSTTSTSSVVFTFLSFVIAVLIDRIDFQF